MAHSHDMPAGIEQPVLGRSVAGGCMVGVVLYGILVMTRPYSSAAGVSPRIFERLLEATL